MTRFQVDSEAVISATGAVQGSSGRIQSEVAGMLSQLTNLQSSWTGSAATAFQGVIAEWRALQQRVDENLTVINHALSVAAQQYAETEQQNARMFMR